MALKYTDIDYRVFSEAADFVVQGGSPYERSTYRYTPLLAWMMVPNSLVHEAVGKCLFILTDILIGISLKRVLTVLVRKTSGSASPEAQAMRVNLLTSMWLLNPIAINVSTRGNAEALISWMVVLCVDLLFSQWTITAAVM